jgi:(3,5-dihydroxyphenyl)acetyl-CoA 1,2-dioxygenase
LSSGLVTGAGILEAAGLPEEEAAAWQQAAPSWSGSFDADARAAGDFLTAGAGLLAILPEPAERADPERVAGDAIVAALDSARDGFLGLHTDQVYAELTGDFTISVRDEELVYLAAERFPGLTPTRDAVAAELQRKLPDKRGVELAQGLFLGHVLDSPRAGAHLINSMLRPTEAALERLNDFVATGVADLGAVRLTREGRAGVLELRNQRHLNAEDDITVPASEVAVDLILLDPAIEVGVLRGAVVDHPRYAGRRVFGSGLNLTRLYQGQMPFMFFITRDLGYVSKIFRGLSAPEVEKLWIAAAETYAIGGACQLLHVVDHVIATRGCRLYLPARKEGIIPGASPLRLPRSVGDRLARQAILSGLEFEAGTPQGDLLCDEVVEPEEVDAALATRIEALTSSGLINAAANRRAMRIGQEPLDVFREYMALFAREQARCHLSPALVANLEQHWKAHERNV